MKFKTQRIEAEFSGLDRKNAKLEQLLIVLDIFSTQEFGKEIVVTEIYRTPEEYKALYGDKPVKSMPHAKWQSADLRSSIYTQAEVDKLLKVANLFTFYGGQRQVAIYHMIAGNVAHFHLQYGLDT